MKDERSTDITRRDLLKGALIGAVGAAGIVACSKKGDKEAPDPKGSMAPGKTPAKVPGTAPAKTAMQYRTFGKTGEKVSALGFGCMRLPIIGKDKSAINEAEAIRLIHYAIDQGVNYFDTAYPYHSSSFSLPGKSEPLLGKALAGGHRDKVKIATKLPVWLVKEKGDFDKLLNLQLKRLNTDHIDFHMLHSLNESRWPNMLKLDAWSFLERAKKDGRIRFAGFSFHDSQALFPKILAHWDWDFTMIQYNYIDQNYQAGKAGLELAKKKGIGIVAMEPLRGGMLARPLPSEAQKIFDAATPRRSNAEWAFRWLLNDPGIHVVLSGMSAMPHVVENVKVASSARPGTMSEADLKRIAQVQAVFDSKKAALCTDCQYCKPCPEGVDIPKNLMMLNDYYLAPVATREAHFKRRYASRLTPKQSAKHCTSCGVCLKRCPQKINIPEKKKEIGKILG